MAGQRQKAQAAMKRTGTVCTRCKDVIRPRDARCVLSGLWTCARCVYELDHPGRPTAPARIAPEFKLQDERLFEVAPYGR